MKILFVHRDMTRILKQELCLLIVFVQALACENVEKQKPIVLSANRSPLALMLRKCCSNDSRFAIHNSFLRQFIIVFYFATEINVKRIQADASFHLKMTPRNDEIMTVRLILSLNLSLSFSVSLCRGLFTDITQESRCISFADKYFLRSVFLDWWVKCFWEWQITWLLM